MRTTVWFVKDWLSKFDDSDFVEVWGNGYDDGSGTITIRPLDRNQRPSDLVVESNESC
jgi:hypothetical protein